MAPSHSLIRSIILGLAGVLLEALLFLPGSPAGAYLEATLGVSTVILIQVLLGSLGLVLPGYAVYAIAVAVVGWRRTFHAEIVGKDRFLLGENVHFKAWFKGELRNGLFTCKVRLPDGNQEWWPAYDTFRREKNRDFGVLSGRAVHEAEWSGPILKEYPTGRYTVHIKVCDRADLDSDNVTVKERLVSFWVLPPGYAPSSDGTSSIASSGDIGFVTQGTESVEEAQPQVIGQEPPRFNLISSSLTDAGLVLWNKATEHPAIGDKTFKTTEEAAYEIQRLGLGTDIIPIRHYQFDFIFRNQGQLSAHNVRISIDQVNKDDTVQRTIFNTVNRLKEVVGKQDFSEAFDMYLPLGTSMLVPTYLRISIDYESLGKAQPTRTIRGHCDPTAKSWTWEA